MMLLAFAGGIFVGLVVGFIIAYVTMTNRGSE